MFTINHEFMSNIARMDDLKTLVLVNDPDKIHVIIEHVANGGSLIDLCKEWEIRYSFVYNAIQRNPDHKKLYDMALVARDEFAKEAILRELTNLASYNIRDAYHKIENPDGTISYRAKHVAELPENLAAAIKEVDSDGGIKFVDKTKPLDMLGKRLGLLTEKIEIKGKITLETLINQCQAEEDKNEQQNPGV